MSEPTTPSAAGHPAPEEPTPIRVPAGLQGLLEHDPTVIELLRDQRIALEARSGLDERTIELVRLGTMVGIAAPPDAIASHVTRLLDLGADVATIYGAVIAVIPLVGVPRLVGAGSAIAEAIAAHEEATTS